MDVIVAACLAGFSLSLFSTLILIRLAPSLNLLDHPDVRKNHHAPMPIVGGMGMFFAIVISFVVFLPPDALSLELLGLGFIIVMLGVLDDRFGLTVGPRLAIQALVVAGMVFGPGVELYELGDLIFTGNIELGVFALVVTIISTVGAMNAVNFSDGLDGLAGGMVMVALGFLLVMSLIAGIESLSLELYLLMSILLGFWVLNSRFFHRKKATVFMGDAGSMLLGFLLAWYFISLSQGEDRIISPVTALWFFALPLFDTIGIMLRRVLRGRSPFAADREHLHHIFILADFSTCKTVTIMLLIAVMLGMIGLLGEVYGVPEGIMFWSFLALFGCYFFIMMHAWKVMRMIKKYHL